MKEFLIVAIPVIIALEIGRHLGGWTVQDVQCLTMAIWQSGSAHFLQLIPDEMEIKLF
jgi:hypothetical protein